MPKRTKETPTEETGQPDELPASDIVIVPEQQASPMRPISAPSPMGPTFGQRVGQFIRFLFRLTLVLIILGLIAAGLYFGLPLVYEKYVQPVRDNTAQLAQLNNRISQNEAAAAELQTHLQAMQTEQAIQGQSIADLGGQVQNIEEQIAAHTQSLAALEQMQANLQAENQEMGAELKRQINVMKAMELLSRARLFMYQSNFGLARQDVQIAHDLLAALQPNAPADFADDLAEVIRRLDLTLANLPAFPVAASDDLDIAWHVLLSGLPETLPTPVIAATPTPVAEITSTPSPLPTLEPTATP